MQCPECGYLMTQFDKTCPRCEGFKSQKPKRKADPSPIILLSSPPRKNIAIPVVLVVFAVVCGIGIGVVLTKQSAPKPQGAGSFSFQAQPQTNNRNPPQERLFSSRQSLLATQNQTQSQQNIQLQHPTAEEQQRQQKIDIPPDPRVEELKQINIDIQRYEDSISIQNSKLKIAGIRLGAIERTGGLMIGPEPSQLFKDERDALAEIVRLESEQLTLLHKRDALLQQLK